MDFVLYNKGKFLMMNDECQIVLIAS